LLACRSCKARCQGHKIFLLQISLMFTSLALQRERSIQSWPACRPNGCTLPWRQNGGEMYSRSVWQSGFGEAAETSHDEPCLFAARPDLERSPSIG
jgi:hypothetical protein